MFERFIVATDLSTASFAVVNCLGALKDFGGRQCLLLQCLSFHEAGSVAYSYRTDVLDAALTQQKEILKKQGFEVEARVIPGFAKQEINRVAADEHYSLIVVGSQGRSMVGGAALGGVAYGLLQGARTPVLVLPVRKKPGDSDECEPLGHCDFSRRLLLATDFSETADRAFKVVEDLVAGGARRVTLLHVQDRSRIEPHLEDQLEAFNAIDRARLEKMKEALSRKGGAGIDIELAYGSPFAEILRVTRERDVQLIVMGSQGRGFVKELFLGSVSHNVARQSEAPVLLIPPGER